MVEMPVEEPLWAALISKITVKLRFTVIFGMYSAIPAHTLLCWVCWTGLFDSKLFRAVTEGLKAHPLLFLKFPLHGVSRRCTCLCCPQFPMCFSMNSRVAVLASSQWKPPNAWKPPLTLMNSTSLPSSRSFSYSRTD